MKIIILQGSPNKNGSTSILAESFTQGAVKSGHSVERIDITDKKIRACTVCVACGYDGPCVQKDDAEQIKAAILDADMIVFATPLYYFGMSAQLKTVVDRFCAFNSRMNRKNMKSALPSVAWNADDWTFDALESHYHTLVKYLDFRDAGMILGKGCGSLAMTKNTEYPKQAYELGMNC